MSLVCVVTIKWCNSVVVCTLCFMSFVSWQNIPAVSQIFVIRAFHGFQWQLAYMIIQHVHVSFYDWKVLGFLISSFTCRKVIGKWIYFISSLLCKVQSFFVHGLGSCLYKVITEGACVLIKGMIYYFFVIDWDTI